MRDHFSGAQDVQYVFVSADSCLTWPWAEMDDRTFHSSNNVCLDKTFPLLSLTPCGTCIINYNQFGFL